MAVVNSSVAVAVAPDDGPKSSEEVVDMLDALADPGRATISKNAVYHRKLEANWLDTKAKAPGAPYGSIEGYASQFDVVDHQREIVRKGAFAKTITEGGGKIVLSARHFARGGDIEHAVAAIVELREDDYGLKFRANFFKDDASQLLRQKILDLRAAGVKVYSSIGYIPVKWGYIVDEASKTQLVEHTEIALKEITLTLVPANEGAVILDAKDTKNTDGAGSSRADDDQTSPKPVVTDGAAVATAKSAGEKDSTAARATATEANGHLLDAQVIAARAKAARLRVWLEELRE